jgi:hypothetical protein
VKFSDPFKAISWDRMHSYAHGLGGKHIWPIIEKYITDDGRGAIRRVDERYMNCFFSILNSFSLFLNDSEQRLYPDGEDYIILTI